MDDWISLIILLIGTPHAAFDNPLSMGEGPLRESIEMRAIVAW